MADIRRRRQLRGEEALIIVPVVRDDLEDEVGFAGQHVAFAHLWPRAHQVLERLEVGLRLADEANMGKDRDAETHRLGVDLRVIALYEPRLFQRAHAPQARGRRNPRPFRQIDVGHATIGLQVGKDAKIDSVEFGAPHNSISPISLSLL